MLPPGYVPTSQAEQLLHSGGNPYDNDPYVNRIKIRGGAYAILMAFYLSPVSMSKEQICRAAQPYCDDEMEDNYRQGRPHGAWKANETLVKHGLLSVHKARTAYTPGKGFRTQGKNSYALTRQGELFVEALFRKRPEAKVAGGGGARRAVGGSVLYDEDPLGGFANVPHNLPQRVARTPNLVATPPMRHLGSTAKNKRGDEERLREWVQNASVGQALSFRVSKTRRKSIHDLCDHLSQTILRPRGLMLQHHSTGDTRGRTLHVTVVESSLGGGRGFAAMPSSAWGLDEDSEDELPPISPFSGAGHVLGSPPKRARRTPPNEAAAMAAIRREELNVPHIKSEGSSSDDEILQQVIQASKREAEEKGIPLDSPETPVAKGLFPSDKDDEELKLVLAISASEVKEHVVLDSEDEDQKPPARRKLDFGDHHVVRIDDSDDEDDNIVDLTHSQESAVKVVDRGFKAIRTTPVTILIDNRERNRNAQPRYLRKELERLISSAPFASIASRDVMPEVEERCLKSGDFGFVLNSDGSESTLPVVVERKRIADLVQRSAKGDHWQQHLRMRDGFDRAFFLLEGDFRSAATHEAFGAQNIDTTSSHCHVVDDENSLLRFICRALMRSESVRFIQTRDEQGSLRNMVVCSTLLSRRQAQAQVATKRPATNGTVTALSDRLKIAGIPWQLAKHVADELGSIDYLQSLYESTKDQEAQDLLLVPLITEVCEKLESTSSTPVSWSKAIRDVFLTPPKNPYGNGEFEKLKHLVDDHATLLSNLTAMDAEAALDATLDHSSSSVDPPRRKVMLDVSPDMDGCIPHTDDEDAFYQVHVTSRSTLPTIRMQVHAGRFASKALRMTVLEGEDIVARLRAAHEKERDYVLASIAAAQEIVQECSAAKDRPLLIVRALQPALDAAARAPGYFAELKIMADLLLLELMLGDVVVLQAIRRSGDLEKIVQEFALGCYLFAWTL